MFPPHVFHTMVRKALLDEGKELKCAVDSAELWGTETLFFINGKVFRYGDNIYNINDIPRGPCVIDMDDNVLKPVCNATTFVLMHAYSGMSLDYEDEEDDGPDRRRAYLQSNISDCQDLIENK